MVAGFGQVFVSPRTGTLFMFSENRQHWYDHQGDVWVDMMTIESEEDGKNLMHAQTYSVNLPSTTCSTLLCSSRRMHFTVYNHCHESQLKTLSGNGFRYDR